MSVVLLIGSLVVTFAAAEPAPWHLAGWTARAEVEVVKRSADAAVDTAAAAVFVQGALREDAADLRVVDAAGSPVPHAVAAFDPTRYALVLFRAASGDGRYFVYFGKTDAAPPAERTTFQQPPGAGAPKGDWVPNVGLVYETRERPAGENPATVEAFAKLLAGSKRSYGARVQPGVSDGYDPFGPSDNYLSLYRGWIRIPSDGTYRFCTASNEASFSFLDGKELIHWPGRHTVDRGLHGEKNATVALKAGLHYLEYYHEEVTLQQMAFLGWRTSADDGPFAAIPASAFPAPHEARVVAYRSPEGVLPRFSAEIESSIWPVSRHEGQYTAVRFRLAAPDGFEKGAPVRWDFGDGQSAEGADVEHVYPTLGTYPVTLKVGDREVKQPLLVYEVEHVTDRLKEGEPAAYAKIARGYDRAKLDAASTRELAFLFAEAEDYRASAEVCRDYLARHVGAKSEWTASIRRLAADDAMRLNEGSVDDAIAAYRSSVDPKNPDPETFETLARLIRLVGIERGEPEKAADIVALVEASAKAKRLDDDARAAYRRAVIAAGDVLLWNGKLDGANDLYRRAENSLGRRVPPQVRAARVGAYPNAIREMLEAGSTGAALDLVEQWDEAFPTDKPSGQTLFWRGKILVLRGSQRDAARHLARAASLASGAEFETESRWLLAESLAALGRVDDAKKELAKLVAMRLNDPFVKKAREKLGGGTPK